MPGCKFAEAWNKILAGKKGLHRHANGTARAAFLVCGDDGIQLLDKRTDLFVQRSAKLGTIVEKGSEIRIPWLLIHGTEDGVVPPNDSNDIFAKANEPKRLHLIGGADHSFTDPAHQAEMVETVIGWVSSL